MTSHTKICHTKICHTLHACAVLAGETGILILGRSGSGKSGLARLIVEKWSDRGLFACLVGDDRITLCVAHGRLIARPHPVLAGHAEVRGLGILPVEHEPKACIGLVVELTGQPVARLPEAADLTLTLHGVILPLLRLEAEAGSQAALERVRLRLATTAFTFGAG